MERTESQILVDMMDGLGHAIGSCGQMVHHFRHPGFLYLREALSKVKDGIMVSAVNPLTAPRITKV